MQHIILKNCFAGKQGDTFIAAPESQKSKRLIESGLAKPSGKPENQKKPDAEKRETKVVEPKEKKVGSAKPKGKTKK